MAKGFAGTVFLTTDDCQASYEELKGRGVEFTEPPKSVPMGSTRASATRRATASASPRCGSWPRCSRPTSGLDPELGPERPVVREVVRVGEEVLTRRVLEEVAKQGASKSKTFWRP